MFLVLFLTCLTVSNIECKLDEKIIGGQPIEITSVPFQLSLHFQGEFFCGAVLITPINALTAAHCVFQMLPIEDFTVYARSKYKQSETKRKISRVKIHPDYAQKTSLNDIAILWFEKELEITNESNIAKLPKPNFEVPVGARVTISGWGVTKDGGPLSEVLQGVDVLVEDREDCKEAYKLHMNVTNSMLCAGVDIGGKDSCQGDSGGPLIFEDVLVGLVSWGLGCARPGYPGVYTQVSSYISFIDNSIAKYP